MSGRYTISSIGPKRSIEITFRKGYRTVEKSFVPFFLKLPTMAHTE